MMAAGLGISLASLRHGQTHGRVAGWIALVTSVVCVVAVAVHLGGIVLLY